MSNAPHLATRIARIARDPRWGGAVHREHLRDLLGCDGRALNAAVAIAVRRGQVELCWAFIVPAAEAKRPAQEHGER